jgi:eukaryotic-like serine/threonine-protein kinase
MAKTVLFGRYRLDEQLGAGGSAQVWRATEMRTGEVVALKRLHPVVFADMAGRERLLREFRALRDLDEPHIVRVRDLELTDDDGALVLDYVAGPSLAARLSTAPTLSTSEAVSIALDVAAALAAAHEAGIVHRDVKPGNILLDPGDGARLTDFGIALAGAGTAGEPALTATGELVGTLRYLAPEQLRGAPATPASDVHALAAVTYETLAGRHAYEAATPVALAEAQARGVEPIPSIPPALDTAIRRALSTNPNDRPADAAAFAAEIRAAIAADRTEPIIVAAAVPDVTSSMPIIPVPPPPPPAASADDALWAPADVAAPAEPIAAAPVRSTPSARSRLPRLSGPLAAALALLLAVFVLSALAPSLGSAGRSSPPSSVVGLPAETVAPTPEPTPAPTEKAKPGKGNDNGKGKGHGHGSGGDQGGNGDG